MRLNGRKLLPFVLLLLLCIALGAAESKRYALVVGNADYSVSPLKNPVNDAEAMAASLQELGFEVTAAYNVKTHQDLAG